MTILGHNVVMKRAKVSELKAHLSSYLSDVRSGDTVIVCERTIPIAQLSPLPENAEDLRIREPEKPIRELAKIRPVRMRKKLDVNRLLRETRGKS
jgi:antitoxin (DNA-binding transcriptional repressor) of toxin-antitoxin stability system